MRLAAVFSVVVAVLFAGPALAQSSVTVEALMPGMAVLTIDGRRHTLRAGQEAGGVLLVEADAKEALLEVNGERRSLAVSGRINGAFTTPERREISVPRDERMQYRTTATINGRRTEVLIDTGANIVALNLQQAQALGVDLSAGQATTVETAGNTVAGRSIVLGSVEVGGIRVDGVAATVIEGEFPRTILLGMSYLQHVRLSEENGVLSLSSKW